MDVEGCRCMLRPEKVHLGAAVSSLPYKLEGHVEEVQFLGPNLRVVMRTPQGEVIALVPTNRETSSIAAGQVIVAGFSRDDISSLLD